MDIEFGNNANEIQWFKSNIQYISWNVTKYSQVIEN